MEHAAMKRTEEMESVEHAIVQYTHAKNWPVNLIVAADAAAALGISELRLVELTEAGYAPHWRIDGGPPLYRLSDLKKWGARNLAACCEGRSFPVHLQVHVEALPCNNAPASIRDIPGLVELPTAAEPGIYFLVQGETVVYIGQSISPLSRIGAHAADPHKDFDRVFAIPVPRRLLDKVEGALIRWLRPRLNGGPDALRAPGRPEDDGEVIQAVFPHYPQPLALAGGAK